VASVGSDHNGVRNLSVQRPMQVRATPLPFP
jgi:hypothetical protein